MNAISVSEDSNINKDFFSPSKETSSFTSQPFTVISVGICENMILSDEKDSTDTEKKYSLSSSINSQNRQKLVSFDDKTSLFLSILKETDFEDGYENAAIIFFREMLNIDFATAIIWINNFYINNIDDYDVIEKVLRILSFVKYEEKTMAAFPIIATSAIALGNNQVKEAAIMAFENWRTKNCLNILKQIEVNTEWLNSYLQQVITELETEIF